MDGFNAFDVEGSVRGCIKIPVIPDPCASAALLVSNIGIAACVDLTIVSGGIGYNWGGDFDLFGGSCDLSPWRPTHSSVARTAAGTARRITLPAGLPSAAFAVDGVGVAPSVTLTGPHGETVAVSRTQPFLRNGNLVAMMNENGTTYLVVKEPAAGGLDDHRRRLGPGQAGAPGGRPAQAVRERHRHPRGQGPRKHAELAPEADRRADRPLAEVGRDVRNVIGTVRARSGQLNFTPADGPGGRRKIVALIQQNGAPRASVVAGSYIAPAALRPGKPKLLRITRRGTRLSVSWRAPVAGFRHVVFVALGNGTRLMRFAGARSRSVAVPGVSPRIGATVTVAGLTAANGRGPSARASIAPVSVGRPATGAWKISDRFGFTSKGGFTVMRGGQSMSGLRVTPGVISKQRCGAGELRIGAQRIAATTRAKVVVRQAGKRKNGTLKLTFSSRRRAAERNSWSPGCKLFFDAKR